MWMATFLKENNYIRALEMNKLLLENIYLFLFIKKNNKINY